MGMDKALVEEMADLAESLRESLSEALGAARCARALAETSCDDADIARGIGAVEKLLAYAMKDELAGLEKALEGMQG